MKKAILATKVGMTQIFDENGVLVPVTVLQAGPCVVTQVKTVENDGYDAIQVGFGEKKERITTKDVSETHMVLVRQKLDMQRKQTQHLRLSTESSDLMTVLSTNLVQRSKPMYLLKETRLTLQQRQKVRDMQAVLRDTA